MTTTDCDVISSGVQEPAGVSGSDVRSLRVRGRLCQCRSSMSGSALFVMTHDLRRMASQIADGRSGVDHHIRSEVSECEPL